MAIDELKEGEIPESMKAALEDAKSKHGEVFVMHSGEFDVTAICKRPPRAIYRKFREEQEGPPAKSAHRFENLFLECVVVPTRKEFDQILDRLPALADSFGIALWDKVIGTSNVDTKRAG